MGYKNAGFEVVGVDIAPQPKYPFEFHQADAITFVKANHHLFDAIHASPPCQQYTRAGIEQRKAGKVYDDTLDETRDVLRAIGKPYIIENVPDAPMQEPIQLCGAMFGLQTYRHRLFESNLAIVAPPHPVHVAKNTKMGRAPVEGEFIQVVGHFIGVAFGQKAMGIDWLGQKELPQAIPPAYTEYLGCQLKAFMLGKTERWAQLNNRRKEVTP